ncbi:MAG: hypothetical protein IJ966_07150 [Bacilli bacterium]|nr:hypothetical protein [Bacilli bacterium]
MTKEMRKAIAFATCVSMVFTSAVANSQANKEDKALPPEPYKIEAPKEDKNLKKLKNH